MAKKKRVVRTWSKEDVKALRALAKAKLSGPQVAKKLRRTRGAVAQKAMLLGVRFRSVNRKRRLRQSAEIAAGSAACRRLHGSRRPMAMITHTSTRRSMRNGARHKRSNGWKRRCACAIRGWNYSRPIR